MSYIKYTPYLTRKIYIIFHTKARQICRSMLQRRPFYVCGLIAEKKFNTKIPIYSAKQSVYFTHT